MRTIELDNILDWVNNQKGETTLIQVHQGTKNFRENKQN